MCILSPSYYVCKSKTSHLACGGAWFAIKDMICLSQISPDKYLFVFGSSSYVANFSRTPDRSENMDPFGLQKMISSFLLYAAGCSEHNKHQIQVSHLIV